MIHCSLSNPTVGWNKLITRTLSLLITFGIRAGKMRLYTLSRLCASKLDQKPQQLAVKLRKPARARLIRRKLSHGYCKFVFWKVIRRFGWPENYRRWWNKNVRHRGSAKLYRRTQFDSKSNSQKGGRQKFIGNSKIPIYVSKSKGSHDAANVVSAKAEMDVVMIRNTNQWLTTSNIAVGGNDCCWQWLKKSFKAHSGTCCSCSRFRLKPFRSERQRSSDNKKPSWRRIIYRSLLFLKN